MDVHKRTRGRTFITLARGISVNRSMSEHRFFKFPIEGVSCTSTIQIRFKNVFFLQVLHEALDRANPKRVALKAIKKIKNLFLLVKVVGRRREEEKRKMFVCF